MGAKVTGGESWKREWLGGGRYHSLEVLGW